MPYKIGQVPGGFKVFHGKHAFSNKALPLTRAKKQRTAIILSELRTKGRLPPK